MVNAKMMQWLVECYKMLVGYLLCLIKFDNYIKEFQKRKAVLDEAEKQQQKDFQVAIDRNLEIKDYVEPWLKTGSEVLAAASTLEKYVEEYKTRVTTRLNWSQRYRLSNEIVALNHKMFEVVRDSRFDEAVEFRVDSLWEKVIELLSSKSLEPSESFKSAFTKVVKALKDDRDPSSMIVVNGQQGVGKSTFVEVVKAMVEKEFKNFKVMMLDVSQSTNADQEIQVKLAALSKAKKAWRESKSKQTILIILEDLCEALDLKSLSIPDHMSYKFLVTTSNLQAFSSKKPVKLDGLTKEEAGKLLQKLASPDSDDINQVAMQIADECKSSPIAVTILGNSLRRKPLSEWRKAHSTLTQRSLAGASSKLDRITKKSVSLSYGYLNNDKTRKCFLLCSLFPKNYCIVVEDLKRFMWGLGIYEGVDSIEGMQKEVDEAIKNLNESFLLLQQNTHIYMQNGIREAARWIASRDESFLKIKVLLDSWRRQDNYESYTAISYVASELVEEVDLDYTGFRSEKLKILFLGGNTLKKISVEFLQWLDALKVLVIHHGHLSLDALQNLKSLRALHLLHCKLNGLSSIGKLEELEILSFQGSEFSQLPKELENLTKLRLLDLFACRKIQRIPLILIRKLSQLEELWFSDRSFVQWWFEEKSAEGSNNTSTSWITSSETLKSPTIIDKRTGETSKALKVSVFSKSESKEQEPKVRYLDRDHIVFYKNHVSPNLVQSVRRVRIQACNLNKVFKDGRILHSEEEEGELLSNLWSLELEQLSELHSLRFMWYGQINNPSLKNLKYLTLKECTKLESLFSADLAQSLEQLISLEIDNCKKLKQLSDDATETIDSKYLPRLTTLLITRCGALEYIFEIKSGEHRILPKLTRLEISHCSQLMHVFSFKFAENEKEIEVPVLETLLLKDLVTLNSFCSENHTIKLSQLQHLEVEQCYLLGEGSFIQAIKHRKLKTVILFKVKQNLCEEVIKFHGGGLSCLEELTIRAITELPFIWKDPKQIVSLHSLTRLEVIKCSKLKHVFPLLIARNLVQLRHLVVKDCKELWQIAVREKEFAPSSSSSTSRLKPVYFPNLVEILIEDCTKMKSLFPATAACLPKLETLTIRNASKLLQVFKDESARVKSKEGSTSETTRLPKDRREKEIIKFRFPKLKKLHLEKLTNLQTLNPVGSCCEFSALNSLLVKECNNLVTIFEKSDSDSDPTVYAKSEENLSSETVNYYKLGRYNVTFEEIKKPDGFIDWSSGMGIND